MTEAEKEAWLAGFEAGESARYGYDGKDAIRRWQDDPVVQLSKQFKRKR